MYTCVIISQISIEYFMIRLIQELSKYIKEMTTTKMYKNSQI